MSDTYENACGGDRVSLARFIEKGVNAYDTILHTASTEIRRAPATYGIIAGLLLSTSSLASFTLGWNIGSKNSHSNTMAIRFCDEMTCPAGLFPLAAFHGPPVFAEDGGLSFDLYMTSMDDGENIAVLPTPRPDLSTQKDGGADALLPDDFLPNEKQPLVINSILHSAEKTGVDKTYMMATGWRETRFDIDGKSRLSSARGLFQFTNVTWFRAIHAFGAKHGFERYAKAISIRKDSTVVVNPGLRNEILALRDNPRASALMTGELAMLDMVRLERMTGLDIDWVDVYIAHFLGITTGANFLEALNDTPSMTVDKVVSAGAYKRNKAVFVGNDGKPKTVKQVFDSIHGKFSARMKRYKRLFELDAAGLLLETKEARAESPSSS